MSLSSLIVQREVATIREVEEALARQVLYGGDLATNLFEVCKVDEARLVPVLAQSYGLLPAPPGELPRPTEEALHLVAAEVAHARNFAPLAIHGDALVIAVSEPLPRDAEQELTFALALPIEQRLAPLHRIRQSLARDYGIPIDRRYLRLLTKLTNGNPRLSSSYPPPRGSFEMKQPPRAPSGSPAPPPRPAPSAPRAQVTAGTFVRRMEAPPARPSKRRRGPLTTEVAKTELEDATERDTIFDLLFEFARQFFDYTALFFVQGDLAEGRDAFGDGSSRDKVARIGVPLDLRNILASAREKKAPIRGVPSREGLDPVLMSDLGRKGNTECVVVPVIVRTRVVALVFGDGGDGGIDEAGVRQVVEVVRGAASAFERLIVRRKLKGNENTAVTARPAPTPKDRPSAEELAPPIRELMSEPMTDIARMTDIAPMTAREPTPNVLLSQPISSAIANPRSDLPPPSNLLAVRKPSGAPIPREEPGLVHASLGSGFTNPMITSAVITNGPMISSMPPARRTKTGAMRRAEAPPLDFGPPSARASFGETAFSAEVAPPSTHRDPPPTHPVLSEPPYSPKAESPPPIRVSPVTDVSPVSPVPRSTPKIVAAVRPDSDDALTPLVPPIAMSFDPDATPIAPPVSSLLGMPPSASNPPPLPKVTPKPGRRHDTDPMASRPVLALVTSDLSRPMPASEQQVSVPAHRPPSSRTDHSRVLPSVIVDVSSEYVGLVDRVLTKSDDEAESSLVHAGGYAMPAIMAKFPGPITVEADRLSGATLPRVGECGPIIRLVASQRRTALPFVLALVESPDREKRFWATYLLSELVYPDAIDAAIGRVFDEDERVRRAARVAARALAETHPTAIVERLAAVATDVSAPRSQRILAIEALGETREPSGVGVLVPLLEGPPPEITSVVRAALVVLARQDFGADLDRWQDWWDTNKERHRLEWLIDSLMNDQAAIRAAASEELKTITKEYFGYYDDLPKRERERAKERYREWWNNVGRVRFSRASTRGA